MVFDEIDTGVSGRMAQTVAEKLHRIAAHRQVLCITHLPQIAAMGDAHFVVEKRVEDGRTGSYVIDIRIDGRVSEIARLIGGSGKPALSTRSTCLPLRTRNSARKECHLSQG